MFRNRMQNHQFSIFRPKLDERGILEKTAKEILENVTDEEILNTEVARALFPLVFCSTF